MSPKPHGLFPAAIIVIDHIITGGCTAKGLD